MWCTAIIGIGVYLLSVVSASGVTPDVVNVDFANTINDAYVRVNDSSIRMLYFGNVWSDYDRELPLHVDHFCRHNETIVLDLSRQEMYASLFMLSRQICRIPPPMPPDILTSLLLKRQSKFGHIVITMGGPTLTSSRIETR